MFPLPLFLFSLICALPASTTPATEYDNQQCTQAVNSLDRCPKMRTCYKAANLYYTTPQQICGCLDATVKASKKVAAVCASKQVGGSYKFSPNDAYTTWSNEKSTRIACGQCEDGKYCLQKLASILSFVQTEKLGLKIDGIENKVGCEEPCFQDLYKACNGKGELAPTLYLYGGDMGKDIFASWKKYCKWGQ